MIFKYEKNKVGLYIHFPFCVHKCSYCDFYSIGIGKKVVTQENLFESYKEELVQRIKLEKELTNLEYETIFIGGGTPSMANLELVENLIQFIKQNLPLAKNFEFTMEANPEDINSSFLKNSKDIGVNRLNVGVQSFQKAHLVTLDRFHDIEKYERVLELLSTSEIEKVGIDLIYGIPNQTEEDFFYDLNKALKYNLKHISLYSLTVEKGTDYYRKLEKNLAKPPEEELQVKLLKKIPEYLQKYNFTHYEVSNFAKESHFSNHNLIYWKFQNYLSIGPSAHGFSPKGRYANSRSLEDYLNKKYSFVYEKPILPDEIGICLFRIFAPIDINSYKDILEDKYNYLLNLIHSWKEKNFCTFENNIFQWNLDSIQYLDDRIYEIANISSLQ
jgi:oxygen-independent coproporphyrinogen-3 oxidase